MLLVVRNNDNYRTLLIKSHLDQVQNIWQSVFEYHLRSFVCTKIKKNGLKLIQDIMNENEGIYIGPFRIVPFGLAIWNIF